MKSKARHKLSQNDLANFITNIHKMLSPYYSAIVWSVVLILAIYVGYTYWSNSTMRAENQIWTAVNTAIAQNNPAIINAVLEDFPEGHLAAVGRVNAGDLYLRNGTYQLFENKAEAANELEKAIDSYETALKIGIDDKDLHERAVFGLARAYESVAGTRAGQGQLDQAIEQYQKLVEQWPEGIYISIAEDRLASLNTKTAKEFYDIFAATEEKTAPTSPTGIGLDPAELQQVPEGPTDDLLEKAGLSFEEETDQEAKEPSSEEADSEAEPQQDSSSEQTTPTPPAIGTSDDSASGESDNTDSDSEENTEEKSSQDPAPENE